MELIKHTKKYSEYHFESDGLKYFLNFNETPNHNGFITKQIHFGLLDADNAYNSLNGRPLSTALNVMNLVGHQVINFAREYKVRYCRFTTVLEDEDVVENIDTIRSRMIIRFTNQHCPPNSYFYYDGYVFIDFTYLYPIEEFQKFIYSNDGWLNNCTNLNQELIDLIEPLSISHKLKMRQRKVDDDFMFYLLDGINSYEIKFNEDTYYLIDEDTEYQFNNTKDLEKILNK